MATYTHQFDTPAYKGTVTVNTGLFIDGKFVEPLAKETIEYVLSDVIIAVTNSDAALSRIINPGTSLQPSPLYIRT